MAAFRNHRRRQLAESDGWARFQITDIGRIKGALTNDRIAASCSQGTTGQKRAFAVLYEVVRLLNLSSRSAFEHRPRPFRAGAPTAKG